MSRTTLRAKGQLTLPEGIRAAAHIEKAMSSDAEITAEGILWKQKVVDATQAWFWTKEGEGESGKRIPILPAMGWKYSAPARAPYGPRRSGQSSRPGPARSLTKRAHLCLVRPFGTDFDGLSADQPEVFLAAVAQFVADVKAGTFR